MRTVTLYFHDETNEGNGAMGQWYVNNGKASPGVIGPEVAMILARNPCYEIEVTFDVDTGKPVSANIAGVELTV